MKDIMRNKAIICSGDLESSYGLNILVDELVENGIGLIKAIQIAKGLFNPSKCKVINYQSK
jgi:hypothetical protein